MSLVSSIYVSDEEAGQVRMTFAGRTMMGPFFARSKQEIVMIRFAIPLILGEEPVSQEEIIDDIFSCGPLASALPEESGDEEKLLKTLSEIAAHCGIDEEAVEQAFASAKDGSDEASDVEPPSMGMGLPPKVAARFLVKGWRELKAEEAERIAISKAENEVHPRGKKLSDELL